MGTTCDVEIKVGYPFLKNDKELTDTCFALARNFLNDSDVIEIKKRMTAEDFSYYTHHVPALFYRLGVGFEDQSERFLHNAHFDVDEKTLELSIGMMAWLAVNA